MFNEFFGFIILFVLYMYICFFFVIVLNFRCKSLFLIVLSFDEVKLIVILNKYGMFGYCYYFDVKVKLYKKLNDKLMIKISGKLLFKLYCMFFI